MSHRRSHGSLRVTWKISNLGLCQCFSANAPAAALAGPLSGIRTAGGPAPTADRLDLDSHHPSHDSESESGTVCGPSEYYGRVTVVAQSNFDCGSEATASGTRWARAPGLASESALGETLRSERRSAGPCQTSVRETAGPCQRPASEPSVVMAAPGQSAQSRWAAGPALVRVMVVRPKPYPSRSPSRTTQASSNSASPPGPGRRTVPRRGCQCSHESDPRCGFARWRRLGAA